MTQDPLIPDYQRNIREPKPRSYLGVIGCLLGIATIVVPVVVALNGNGQSPLKSAVSIGAAMNLCSLILNSFSLWKAKMSYRARSLGYIGLIASLFWPAVIAILLVMTLTGRWKPPVG